MARLIEIPYYKGTVLYLTPEEFSAGLKRGKAIKRSRKQKEREKEKFAGKDG